jgi:acyl-CoA oxidase
MSLSVERLNPSFPIQDMIEFLEGGKKATLLKNDIMLELERDPVLKVSDAHDLTLAQTREKTMAKVAVIGSYISREPLSKFRKVI